MMPTSQILRVEWESMKQSAKERSLYYQHQVVYDLSYNLWDVAEPAGQTVDEET